MSGIRPWFCIVAALIVAVAAQAAFAAPAKKWNLLFILADDHAKWAVSSFGYPEVKTPNIDELARQGARFSNAFATSPICAPSRLTIYTGLESVQVGTFNDVSSAAKDPPLPYGVPSWARDLKRVGYSTGFIGKWHLGPEPEHSPTRYGFDYFFGFRAGAMVSKDPLLARGEGEPKRYQGYTDDMLTDDAIQYMKSQAGGPFALAMNMRGPHLPYTPEPEEDLAAVRDIDPAVPKVKDPGIIGFPIPGGREGFARFVKDQRRDYYAAVHNVDRNVGRLMQALKDLGIADRTIVIYTSDNGYLLGERGLFNKGAASPIQYDMFDDNRELWVINLFDIAMRVPMVVKWPGVTKPGSEFSQFVTLHDLYRTIHGMLNVPLAEDSPVGGMDFSKLLRKPDTPWRDAVFGQYTSDTIGNTEFPRMIRTDRWKLVLYYLDPSNNKLYDIKNDPDELTNLYYRAPKEGAPDAQTIAAVRQDLESRLRAWQNEIGDPALELEKDYDEAKRQALQRWQDSPKEK